MRLSAVICTRNRPELIGQAVASVLANDYPTFELIVVDQSDTDATRRALAPLQAAAPTLRYVHTSRVGLSAAYNTAIAESRGEVLAFTDDDCVAPRDWLHQIATTFAREPDVDLIYGQVLCARELRGREGVVPELRIGQPRRISRRHGFVIYGMGANFAARRRLFEVVGGFDEALGGGGPLRSSQDFDLQYRVYRAGLVTLLAPEVVVMHYGWRSPDDWPKTLLAYGVGNGGFFMKHVRCRDLFALRLLLGNLINVGGRDLVKAALGRPYAGAYLRGLLRGLWESFRFPVDRRRRVYVVTGA
jgi:glycosyltransferase involved in cell wall biosynthesis